MSGLKKLLGGGKKKSSPKLKNDDRKNSLLSAAGSLSNLNRSSSSLQVDAPTENLGGYSLKEKDLSKFLKAAWNGDFNKVKQIASKKVNWNETDKGHRTALHLACAKGYEQIVVFLVSHGANVNVNDSEGKTPLMKACENNNSKNAECLLNNGASTNVFDVNHVSAMHIAAAQGNVDIGIMLADGDAKLDSKDQSQVTPLHLCCGLGHKEFVEFLLSEYVAVNCVDDQKRTPLMAACVEGHLDIVQLLLQNNADLTLLDKNGNNAKALATINDNHSIATLLDEHSNKMNATLSPSGSIISKKSVKEMFSPVAQSLKEMFSATASPTGSMFGGPAMNISGNNNNNEKSEDSHSEDLGDNSWGDSDTESEADKKPKGLNFSAMLKKKETEKKKDAIKIPVLTTAMESPNTSSSLKRVDSASRIPKPTDSFHSPVPSPNNDTKSEIPKLSTKEDVVPVPEKEKKVPVPWQDNDFSDDSESECGDEDLETNFAAGVKNEDVKHVHEIEKNQKHKDKVAAKEKPDNKQAEIFAVPLPPPDIEFTDNSSDFDSSQPEESFSDLPLSDLNRNNKFQNKTADDAKKLFFTNKKSETNSSTWDSTDDEVTEDSKKKNDNKEIVPNKKTALSKETMLDKEKSDNKKPPDKNASETKLSMSPEDESDWDSEPAIPSEPSEEILPPSSPVAGSDFEPSSMDDETESDFDLKAAVTVTEPDVKHESVFQTEVITPRKEEQNIDSDDDIELMMKMQTSTKTVIKPTKEVTKDRSNQRKQLADLGLDLGSSMSSVSDPEGLSEMNKDTLDVKAKPDNKNRHVAKKQYDAMGIVISDGMSTETESDWEKDLRRSRESKSKGNDISAMKESGSTQRLRDTIQLENDQEKEKEKKRLEEYEANRKAHEDLLAAEIAEELRNEIEANDIEFDSSDDFSLSEGKDGIVGKNVALSLEDGSERGTSDHFLEDGNRNNSEIHDGVEIKQNKGAADKNKEHLLIQKEKDEGIKSKLQDILERSKSPPQSSNKVSQLLHENEENLQKRQEEIRTHEQKVKRIESNSLDMLKEVEKKNQDLKVKEELHRKKALEDEERIKQLKHGQNLLREQENNLQQIQYQKGLIEKEVERQKEELQQEEEARLKNMKDEESILRERLQKEETERLHVIQEMERKAKEEHENNERLRNEQFEKEYLDRKMAWKKGEQGKRLLLKKEEEEVKLALEKEKRGKMLMLENEEKERKLAFQLEEENRWKASEIEVAERKKCFDEEKKERKGRLEEEIERRKQLQEEEEIDRKKRFDDEDNERKIRLEKEDNERRKRLEVEEHALSDEERNRKIKFRIEDKLRAELLKKEEQLRKDEKEKQKGLLALEKAKLKEVEDEIKKRKEEFEVEEENRRKAFEKEVSERKNLLDEEENERKERLDEKEKERKRRLEEDEIERRRQLQKEEERKKELEKANLKELDEMATKRKKDVEDEIKKREKELVLMLENKEKGRIEELEKRAREKEIEITERLKKLEYEKRIEWEEEEEEAKLMKRLEEKGKFNDSFEENRLKEYLREEEISMREKLKKKLDQEENERKRKLSDEGKTHREKIKKTNEEENKKFVEEKRRKEEEFERECKRKEVQLAEKLQKLEEQQLKEISDREEEVKKNFKVKENEVYEMLSRIEEEKQKQWEKKENELMQRLDEINKKETKEKQRDDRRFHELEKTWKQREQELEQQLDDIKEKQNKVALENTNSNTKDKGKILTPIPVEELVMAVHQTTEEAVNMDGFEEVLPDQEVQFNAMYVDERVMPRNNVLTTPTETLNKRLNQSRQQRNEAMKRIAQLENSTDTNEKNINDADDYLIVDMDNTGRNPLLSELRQSDSPSRYLKAASTPVAMNNIQDETFINELQDELRETRRQIDLYREKTSIQERMKRDMEYDIEELHRTIDILSQSQNDKDKTKLDMDLEIRSINYKLEQETESRNMSERLCNQLKDQLGRSEKKLTREAESRQAVELANRKIQADVKEKDQQIHQFESEVQDLQLTLDMERQSRALQEDLYQEQLRQHEAILQEAQKTSHNHAKAVSQLEMLSETKKQVENTTDMLKMELAKAKGELSRALSQLDENRSLSENKTNKLRDKLQEKTEDLSAVEKNLFQAQLHLENEKSNKRSFEERLTISLENETNSRQRLEIVSLKSRLEKSNQEIDRLAEQKSLTDKDLLSAKYVFSADKLVLEKELAISKDQLKHIGEKLATTEEKLQRVTGEFQNVGLALVEKKGEADVARKDIEQMKSNIEVLEDNLRNEKVNSDRLESKLEDANDRINLLHAECEKLQKEALLLKEQYVHRDRSANEKQENTNSYMMSLKDEFQKDLNETKHVLTNVEAEKTAYSKEKENVLEENSSLKQLIVNLEDQIKQLQDQNSEIEQQLFTASMELEKTHNIHNETANRLVKKSNDVDNIRRANLELKEGLEDLKKENVAVEADLQEQKAKADILIQELRSANEAREALEALLSNTKGNNVALEEKLYSESLFRTQREREAEEHKGLWESEVKSRSKLGLKMIQMEKETQKLKAEIEEEKRRTRRALDLKKGSDSKIELYEQRSVQHQKDVSVLRNKLKQYQRKIKELESSESRIPALQAEFELERNEMSNNVTNMRRQLDQLSEQLTREQERRSAAEKTNREQMKELTDLKTREKVNNYEHDKYLKKCRALETEIDKQKKYYDRNYIANEEIEGFKRELETQARLDLNKRLQEVNMHLEEQSLAREAFEKIRNDKEQKTRKGFEDTIMELKTELSQVRTTLHEGLAKRDTTQTEAKRFKELFEKERSAKDRLADKLNKTNDRMSLERSRTNYLFDETINKSKVTKRLFDEPPDKERSFSLSPRIRDMDFTSLAYRPKLWSTPVAASPPPHKETDSSIKRRNRFS